MNKSKLNYYVDIFMTLAFIITAKTGLIIFFFIPSGVKRGGYQEFMGIIKQDWTIVHNYAGILMTILVLIHFILHWNWLVCMTKGVVCKKEEKE